MYYVCSLCCNIGAVLIVNKSPHIVLKHSTVADLNVVRFYVALLCYLVTYHLHHPHALNDHI